MAAEDVKGVNFTLDENGNSGNVFARGVFRGKLRRYIDTYELAALEADSTIKVGPKILQPGVRVVGIKLYNDALGASTTLDVGDSEDDNRYISAYNSSSAGRKDSDLIAGVDYVIGTNDGDNVILVTIEGATGTGTIKVEIITAEE